MNTCVLQSSENNHSLDDTDEEENHALESQDNQEGALGPPHVIRCGGEDWETGGPMSQRHKLNADMRDTSLVRRGRGKVAVYTPKTCDLWKDGWMDNTFCVF